MESAIKHQTFNQILGLMNSDEKFKNRELFRAVYELAMKQGEITDEILNEKYR